MRIVIDILHPAHVHVFRNFWEEMERRGHEVVLFSRDKDVTLNLLEAYGTAHQTLSAHSSGPVGLATEMAIRCIRMTRRLLSAPPDILMGVMGPAIAVVGKAFPRSKIFVFYDNESARLVNRVVYKLADKYCTPAAYQESAGANHIRYQGYHELAYLHPSRFTPDPQVPSKYGLGAEPLFLLRFVAFKSIHEFGEEGLSLSLKRKIIDKLVRRGRVVISSELPLPDEFEPFRLQIQPEDIHHILAITSIFVGESSTMASEAAILGAHALFVSKTGRGVNVEQEKKYGINHCFSPNQDESILLRLDALLAIENIRSDAERRRDLLIADSVDLTQWMVDMVELEAEKLGLG